MAAGGGPGPPSVCSDRDLASLTAERGHKRIKLGDEFVRDGSASRVYKPSPRFLSIMHADENRDLSRVSPFLIHKVISYRVGQVKNVKKLRNGTLLVETMSDKQTEKLLQLTCFSDDIAVKVAPHDKFNSSKGVIFCSDLVYLTKDELLEELKSQNVIDIYRVTRKVDNRVENTPTLILTFGTPDLPTKVRVGYYSVPVRQYIRNPARCFRCHVFSHTAKYCKAENEICAFCGEVKHEGDEMCANPLKCINCLGDHAAFSRKCPRFLEEKSVIEIATRERISIYAARSMLLREKEKEKGRRTFSSVASSQSPSGTTCVSCVEMKETIKALTSQVTALALQIKILSENKCSSDTLVRPVQNIVTGVAGDTTGMIAEAPFVKPIKISLRGSGVSRGEQGFLTPGGGSSSVETSESELLESVKAVRSQGSKGARRAHKSNRKKK